MLAVLLAGVVAVNVAVLQLNVRLDELGRERVQLQGETKRLSSQLSSASANARIESQARDEARARTRRPRADLPPPAGAADEVTERLSNRRIRLLLGLFVLVFAGTLARAVWIQGVQASRFEGMAERQHQGTTVIPAGRGTIFDRTGEPLAIGEQATTVYADPREVKDPRRVALAAAKALGVDAEKLYPVLADRSNHFVYVKRKADPTKAAALEKLNLPGLGFYAEELRYYPQRGVAAHVLGYAGIDNNGLEGLERSLDRALVGKPGSQTTVRDPSGRVDRRDRDQAGAGRRGRLPDDRPPDPVDCRERAPRHGQEVGSQGRQRGRARPAHRRRACDGGCARLRREQVRLDARLEAAQPRRHRRVRARLDLQGRHRRRGAVGEDRQPDDRIHAAVLDSRRRPDHP